MSQQNPPSNPPHNPPPLPPLPYYGTPPSMEPQLPGMAKAVAIVGIILGGFGCLAICALPQLLMGKQENNPADVIHGDAFLLPYTFVVTLVTTGVAAMMLAGGIKCLKLSPSGRRMLVGSAAALATINAIGMLVGVFYSFPKMSAAVAQAPAGTAVFRSLAYIGEAFGIFCGLIWIGYFFWAKYVLSQPEVVSLFEPRSATGYAEQPPMA